MTGLAHDMAPPVIIGNINNPEDRERIEASRKKRAREVEETLKRLEERRREDEDFRKRIESVRNKARLSEEK